MDQRPKHSRRLRITVLLSGFGVLAVLLSLIGVYE
jgi:hypothetical protein